MFGFVLFGFFVYLMPKPSLQKNNGGIYLIYSRENKGVHTIPKGISLKVNITQLEFKLVYYEVAV